MVTGRTGETYRLRLVTHDHQTFDRFYNRFANPTLWFLHHYLWNLIEEPVADQRLHDAWSSYGTANESFAAAVLEELEREPDTAVWFHDYHLYSRRGSSAAPGRTPCCRISSTFPGRAGLLDGPPGAAEDCDPRRAARE